MFKNCRICGKEFEAQNSRYCTCSPACSIKNRNIMVQKYYYAHPEYNQRDRDRHREKRRKRFVPCLICGKNVQSVYNGERYTRKRYHEECVLKEALQAVSEGKGRKDKTVVRAWNTYAYTVKDLKEMLKK